MSTAAPPPPPPPGNYPPPGYLPPPTLVSPPPAPPRRLSRKGLLIAAGVALVLAAGGGVAWWALDDDEPDAMTHVEVNNGKVITESDTGTSDEDCDDYDEYTYNDCDTESETLAYSFVYKITNKAGNPANYSAIVNAFDKDGDFVGQTHLYVTHLAPKKSKADSAQFDDYELEEGHSADDIDSIKLAHVERTGLAN